MQILKMTGPLFVCHPSGRKQTRMSVAEMFKVAHMGTSGFIHHFLYDRALTDHEVTRWCISKRNTPSIVAPRLSLLNSPGMAGHLPINVKSSGDQSRSLEKQKYLSSKWENQQRMRKRSEAQGYGEFCTKFKAGDIFCDLF